MFRRTRISTGITCAGCGEKKPRSEYNLVLKVYRDRERLVPDSSYCIACKEQREAELRWKIIEPLEWWGDDPSFSNSEIKYMLQSGCFERGTILEYQEVLYRVYGGEGHRQHTYRLTKKEISIYLATKKECTQHGKHIQRN